MGENDKITANENAQENNIMKEKLSEEKAEKVVGGRETTAITCKICGKSYGILYSSGTYECKCCGAKSAYMGK